MAETAASPLSLLSSASSWSLAEDASLLSAMQELSLSITKQTSEILDRMDQLSRDAASTQTRLQTTTNNFMLLSNIKFIEARVYEDSEAESGVTSQEAVVEEKVDEENATKEALHHGLNVLQTAFEKVEINDSDSDSEAEEEKIISVLQPKNPYHVRSLPAIIGTQAWIDDDNIGLVDDEPEEASESSESESEEEEQISNVKEESEYSDSDTEKNQKTNPKPVVSQMKDQSDSLSDFSDDDDELFKPPKKNDSPEIKMKHEITKNHESDDDNTEDDEFDSHLSTVDAAPKSFASELSSKLGLGATKHIEASQKENSESDNDTQVQSKVKKSVRLPPKKSVLFDSSDSDDDLFSPKEKVSPPKVAPSEKPSANTDDGAKDSKNKKLPPLPPPSTAKPTREQKKVDEPLQPQAAENKEDSLSDDEFFSSISTKSMGQARIDEKAVGKSIFEDSSDEEDMFADIKVGNKSTIGSKPVPEVKKNLFEDSDDSDDLFADLISKNQNVLEKNTTDSQAGTSKHLSPSTQETNTIDSKESATVSKKERKASEADDIFSTIEKPNSVKIESEADHKKTEVIQPLSSKKPVGGVSMFGNNPPPILMPHKRQSESDSDDNAKAEKQDQISDDDSDSLFSSVQIKSEQKLQNEEDKIQSALQTGTIKENLNEENISEKFGNEKSQQDKTPPPVPPASKKPIKDTTDEDTDKSRETEKKDFKEKLSMQIKKPAGGVSMFGGFDPRALVKSNINEEVMDTVDADSKQSIVGKAEIGSENPTSPETLVTLTKSRPKMRTGRKPPSRAGRKLAIEASNAMSFDVTDAPTEKMNSNDQNVSTAEQTQSKPPIGGISILGGLSDALKQRKTNKSESGNILNSSNENEENIEDNKENGDEIKTTANIEDSVDLFEKNTPDISEKLSFESKESTPIEPPPMTNPKTSDSNFSNKMLFDEDDRESVTFEPPPMTDLSEKLDKKKNLFGFDDSDSDDDMFSSLPTPKKKTTNSDPIADIFGSDSDDDLFSSLSKK